MQDAAALGDLLTPFEGEIGAKRPLEAGLVVAAKDVLAVGQHGGHHRIRLGHPLDDQPFA